MSEIKADEAINKIRFITPKKHIKTIAVVLIQNEYKSNRELLYNLKSRGIYMSDNVYLSRLQGLIDEEISIINHIKNTKI